MGQYDEEIADAKELITEFGQSVEWQQTVEVENTEQPWKGTSGTPKKYKTKIAFVAAKDNEWRKLLAYLKGTEVASSRMAGLMAGGQKFIPSLKDFVIRGDKTLAIESIDIVQPSDQPILYIVEFKV